MCGKAYKTLFIYVNDIPVTSTISDSHAEELKKEYEERHPDATVKIVTWYD